LPLNIVLVEPEIPWNTGNAGRTCVAAGASLHLVGTLGFSLSERRIKRSGMDYWPKLRLSVHETWEAFKASLPAGARLIAFSPAGKASLWEARFQDSDYLIFGRESVGLDERRLSECQRTLRIPMRPEARSLNLSTSVAVALYEAQRQLAGDRRHPLS
jgi:tRNA (cytidine/uridine-2'-O-)-methyltransferase